MKEQAAVDAAVERAAELGKIREFALSGDSEMEGWALQWLSNLIGEDAAFANLYLLHFYETISIAELDEMAIDENNYAYITIKERKTFRLFGGYSYDYKVRMVAVFKGKHILNRSCVYSRWAVGQDIPANDFVEFVFQGVRSEGYRSLNALFVPSE